ncbi:MAG: helicase-related protein [Candidatus Micrarchaeota archaeon]|nr:helicase-related protein [Candidatus Micrarchaeota archaeon]
MADGDTCSLVQVMLRKKQQKKKGYNPNQLSLGLFGERKPKPDENTEEELNRKLAAYDFSLLKPRPYEHRTYQKKALLFALEHKNAIIQLGTGTGKTEIEFSLAAEALKRGKVMLVADTHILCKQHYDEARGEAGFALGQDEIALAVGENRQRRKDPEFYKKARLVIGTAEAIMQDIIRDRLHMEDFKLVILDEVHHTTGADDYMKVVNLAIGFGVPRVGFSASPAENKERLLDLMDNMQVNHIFSGDQKEIERYVGYAPHIKVWVPLEEKRKEALNVYSELIKELLERMVYYSSYAGMDTLVKHYNNLVSEFRIPRTKELNSGMHIINTYRDKFNSYDEQSEAYFLTCSYHAAIYKASYHYATLERIGTEEFFDYGRRLESDQTKAAGLLRGSAKYQKCLSIAAQLDDHPKLIYVYNLLAEHNEQAIIFVETKSHALRLAAKLSKSTFPAVALLGKSEMSEKKQLKIRKDFEDGKYQVLVATSVANEGLHMPAIKLCINYSAPYSHIAMQQRIGRVRSAQGKIYTLIGQDTSDVILYHMSQSRKKSLKKVYEDWADH